MSRITKKCYGILFELYKCAQQILTTGLDTGSQMPPRLGRGESIDKERIIGMDIRLFFLKIVEVSNSKVAIRNVTDHHCLLKKDGYAGTEGFWFLRI